MGSGGKGGGGDTTQKTEPWGPQKAPLQYGFDQARQIYDAGGAQPFPNATYTPFAPQTEAGLSMLQSRAAQGSPLDTSAQTWAKNTLNASPGFSSDFTGADQGQMNSGLAYTTMGAQGGLGLGGAAQYYGGNQAQGAGIGLGGASQFFSPQGPGAQQLGATASGAYLNANPYLDATFNRAADAMTTQFQEGVQPGINAAFGQGSRTGSGLHALTQGKAAGEYADAVGNMAADIYGGNYQAERARQLQAGNSLAGLGLAGQSAAASLFGQERAQDMARRQGAMGAYQQGLSNYLGAGGRLLSDDLGRRTLGGNLYAQELNQQRNAANMAPTLSGMDYRDINAMLQGGGIVQDQANAVLQDQITRWNLQQSLPQQTLANYIAAIQGNYGGTTATEGQQVSKGQSALGGAMSGAALGMQTGNPFLALGGGILGAATSLF